MSMLSAGRRQRQRSSEGTKEALGGGSFSSLPPCQLGSTRPTQAKQKRLLVPNLFSVQKSVTFCQHLTLPKKFPFFFSLHNIDV